MRPGDLHNDATASVRQVTAMLLKTAFLETSVLELSSSPRPLTMSAHLDPHCIPHVFDTILSEVRDRKTLLAARLVSTDMLKLVDSRLCHVRLDVVRTGGKPDFDARTATQPDHGAPSYPRVPYFFPNGSPVAQAAAMGRLTTFTLDTDLMSEHVAGFLRHLPPAASVTLRHYMWRGQAGALPSLLPRDLALPPCQALTIDIGSLCACQSTGLFTHVASRVNLWIWSEGYAYASPGTSNCPVMSGVINLGVSQLIVSGNVLALPGLLGNVNVEASPTLHIRFEPDCALYPAEQTTLLADTHSLLNIPKGQIAFA